MRKKAITLAYGDGIGPEIMEAVLEIVRHSGVMIPMETVSVGREMYEKGIDTGIPEDAWRTILRNEALLKAPITTPQGGGYRSLNVELRKRLGLYSNIRHCISYSPVINGAKKMDMIIIRENEEDIYSGIEYRLTADCYSSLKLITESESQKICRYAFEHARAYGRKKVTCMSKDNIMKMTDGAFHRAFDMVAKEYDDLENEHYIIDIGSARIANRPSDFDVIVTENLYGDIISDIAAEVSGSVGMVGSSNIGNEYAMFEAIHGSAPDIAGQDVANPSGLLNAAVQMLIHLGSIKEANSISNAWLKTLEDGIHTADIYQENMSKQKVGTKDFGLAVIENLGNVPSNLFGKIEYSDNISYNDARTKTITNVVEDQQVNTSIIGVDLYIDIHEKPLSEIIALLTSDDIQESGLLCKAVSSKGLVLWPVVAGIVLENNSDLLCCRFVSKDLKCDGNLEEDKLISNKDIRELLRIVEDDMGLYITQFVKLRSFDNKPGFYNTSGA